MMELITYTVWFLAIMQIADTLTWILRRIESLIKKSIIQRRMNANLKRKKTVRHRMFKKLTSGKLSVGQSS